MIIEKVPSEFFNLKILMHIFFSLIALLHFTSKGKCLFESLCSHNTVKYLQEKIQKILIINIFDRLSVVATNEMIIMNLGASYSN